MLNKSEKKIVGKCISDLDAIISKLSEINERHSERFPVKTKAQRDFVRAMKVQRFIEGRFKHAFNNPRHWNALVALREKAIQRVTETGNIAAAERHRQIWGA